MIVRWTGEMLYVDYWMYRFAWNGRMQWLLTVNDGYNPTSRGMCGNHNGDPDGKLDPETSQSKKYTSQNSKFKKLSPHKNLPVFIFIQF